MSGAWVRAPQGMDRPAAAYFEIVGGAEADALLGVTSPAAAMVELHETTTDSSGMTGMHPIGRLEIPAGETVILEPGGYHLMLMAVAEGAIEAGKAVELRLTFEKAGAVVVQAEVRAG
ncbi:MAG TPA: copper chaperone PCu(A)C [Candidatus Deferrimicrobiaceae bacterium]|nr:copper chaperone PCu(A)C [Candidatus Deferrimicrobiaceae bacterium]